MISIQQTGALLCNRVGHNENEIQAVCMSKGCDEPIPCCPICMTQEHKNHDFVKIPVIREQINQSQNYLSKLSELSESICQVCLSWKKQVQKMIDLIQESQLLPENLTISQLINKVQYLRESVNIVKQQELIQTFTSQMKNIVKGLSSLTNQINSQLQNQYKEVIKQESQNLKFVLTQQLERHQNEVIYVAISHDDKYLASSDYGSSNIILWDLKLNKQFASFQSKQSDSKITALQFSHDDSMLAVGVYHQQYGKIEIFDLNNLTNISSKIQLEGHESMIYRIIFIDDSKQLISVSWDKSLRLWDLFEKEINSWKSDKFIDGVAHSAKLKMVACCDYNGYAYLFDIRAISDLNLKLKWQAHVYGSYCIKFVKNSTVIMTSSFSETRFWQVDDILNNNFNYFKEVGGGGQAATAYPPDDPQVIINCDQSKKFVNLWNYNSNQLIQSIEIPGGLFEFQFAITSNIKKIITGGNNRKVNIFERQ